MSLIDMHVHTTYSDGELEPNEVIDLAIEKGIGTIAITDHDTIDGLQVIDYDKNINIIKGIELSALSDKGTMHILGYGIDIENIKLNEKIKYLKRNSFYSIIGMLDELKKEFDIVFDAEDITELFNSIGSIGRPQLSKLLLKHGYETISKEAFNKYLIPVYKKVKEYKLGITGYECIDLIKEAGGLSVLAHPYQLKMNNEELENLIVNMKDRGLDGIEAYHSGNSLEQRKQYLEYAEKYDLLVSGGSDYHGKIIKPKVELGTGVNNNLKIKKLSLVDKLNNR